MTIFDRAEAPQRRDESFLRSILHGLSQPRKSISSRWLYDARGSELFEEITRLPAYYPTRVETAILTQGRARIADFCDEHTVLLEYGAGSGAKTEILLAALKNPRAYVPIDIAVEQLEATAARMAQIFPDIQTLPVIADFGGEFDLPASLPPGPRRAFFPGSTIGNLSARETVAFLARLRRHVRAGGRAIIGVDLRKDVKTLIEAYDDPEGVTAAFDLNLLARINRELAGDFPLDRFFHEARWNAADSAIEMHLVSMDARIVVVGGARFAFRAGETIHTESSRKYEPEGFIALAAQGGFAPVEMLTDSERRFAVFCLEASV